MTPASSGHRLNSCSGRSRSRRSQADPPSLPLLSHRHVHNLARLQAESASREAPLTRLGLLPPTGRPDASRHRPRPDHLCRPHLDRDHRLPDLCYHLLPLPRRGHLAELRLRESRSPCFAVAAVPSADPVVHLPPAQYFCILTFISHSLSSLSRDARLRERRLTLLSTYSTWAIQVQVSTRCSSSGSSSLQC